MMLKGDRKRHSCIRLIMHPENQASQRVVEKGGFRLKSTARRAWFHRGRRHGVLVSALLQGSTGPGMAPPAISPSR